MVDTHDQVRPIALSLPPQELKTLVIEVSAAKTGSIGDTDAGQGPSAGTTKWQRLVERLRNKPISDDPLLDAAWRKFREDMRDVHENFFER